MDTQGPVISIAAFFRDARAGAGSSRQPGEKDSALLAEFFARYSYDACSADQLLALADLALRAANSAVAREALQRVLQTPGRNHLAYYKLGRLELGDGRAQEAADVFAIGADIDPAFAFNWMGSTRALAALGRQAEAAAAAERFASFGLRPHSPDELPVLAAAADYLFEKGERLRAGPIYALLRDVGFSSPKTVVRLAETMISAGEPTKALDVLRPAYAEGRLDSWGRRALAYCESLTGHHEAALALAEAIITERPQDAGFVSTWLDVTVRAGRARSGLVADWPDLLARFGDRLPPAGRAELAARAALAKGELQAAAAALDGLIKPQTRLFDVAIEIAYVALGQGGIPIAHALAQLLAAASPAAVAPLILQTDIYLRQQMWTEASAALALVSSEDAQLPRVRLKWFEYYCFVGDTDRARQAQAGLEEAGLDSGQFALPILRFLAEQKLWPELVDRAAAWIGPDFRYDQIGYVLFRAAKHTGRQAEMLSAIETIEGWPELDLARLHAALAWDAAQTLPEMNRLAAMAGASTSRTVARRMAVQRQILARAHAPERRRALFLCTDAAYLCATIVALHSALGHSAPGREDCFLVVDDDAAPLAARLVRPISERGFSVTVVPASEIVRDASRLSAAYGLFTSGHTLASAAYYRIFFALHLRRLGVYARAAYIDSDVLVRAPLDRLFDADLQGQPLAARVETSRPEVTRAIVLHGLTGDLYFNSGVLLFDLESERLDAALDASVAAIADEGVTLLFHDQCALNLGFRDGFARLDTAFNTPVGEATRLADLPKDAAILHYLDRPKPWSAAYDGECGALWFDMWAEAADVIGAAAAVEVFGLIRE